MIVYQCNKKTINELKPQFQWGKNLIDQIIENFKKQAEVESDFPCSYLQNAFKRKLVNFSLIPYDEEKQKYDFKEFLVDLDIYTNLNQSKKWDGKNIHTHEPLLVLFENNSDIKTTSQFEETFQSSIQYLIDNDDDKFKNQISIDPSKAYLNMHFKNREIFINASHPNNKNRSFCNSLMFEINTRECYVNINENQKQGNKIREGIRNSVDIFISKTPVLKHH